MSERTPDKLNTPPVSSQTDEVDTSRRKLAGAALGVSAIFTLASRPVLAQQCLSPSGFLSGTLVSHHGSPVNCSGKSPAQWVTENSSTISSTKFSSIFADVSMRVEWGNDSLKKVMQDAGATNVTLKPNPISAEFAAALLNIRAGTYPAGLNEAALRIMWTEFAKKNSYEVTAGVFWTPSQIVSYLQYLRTT